MTDGIRSALVSPTPRQAPANDRSSLLGDDQVDFGQALLDPRKGGEQPARDHKVETAGGREKRWQKFAERLAANDATTAEATPKVDAAAAEDAEAVDVDPALPDAATKEPAADSKTAEAAMPLILALSELRKAASQPAAANAEQAAPDENANAPASTDGADAAKADILSFAAGRAAARSNDASALQQPTPPTAQASASTEAAAQAKPAGETSGEAAAPAEKPARPAPARQPEQAAAANRVTVISEQVIPAPAPASTGTTAGALALAIASDAPRHLAAASAVQQLQGNGSSAPGTHVLKIQLRPVELGMVTANLQLTGDQLAVEIQVENAEAYHRLSTDREALNSALRGLGFDVDHITIQQPQAASSSQARSDGDALSPGSGGRDQQAFQSGGTGSEGGHSGNGRATGGAANEEGTTRNISSSRADRSGSSLYI